MSLRFPLGCLSALGSFSWQSPHYSTISVMHICSHHTLYFLLLLLWYSILIVALFLDSPAAWEIIKVRICLIHLFIHSISCKSVMVLVDTNPYLLTSKIGCPSQQAGRNSVVKSCCNLVASVKEVQVGWEGWGWKFMRSVLQRSWRLSQEVVLSS